MTTWYVYVLYSVSSGRLYTGISNDPGRRLEEHNAGRGAKATRAGRPWKIVRTWTVTTKSEALRLEARIKKLRRIEKLVLVGLAA